MDINLPVQEAEQTSPRTWADVTAQDEEEQQKSIDDQDTGTQTGDQELAWSRVLKMTDEDLRNDTSTIDRSKLHTYHFDPSLVNTTPQETSFDKPEPLPAWAVQKEFLTKLNACKFLIIKAPTGSGKSTIFPALAAKVMPKEKIMCTQVKRNTTEAVCQSTRRMWKRSSQDLVVGFKHGMSDKQASANEKTRILFCTEGIARNEILSLDRNKISDTAIRGCKILLVDEAHSNNVDTELIIASVLTRLNAMHNFKLVVMSATLDVSSFYQRAYEAGLDRNAVDHVIMEERTKTIEHFVLRPSETARDNLEMAVRAVVQFHNSFPTSYKKTGEGTMLVFVSGKAEIAAFIDILTNLQNRGFTANLYPYAFHADLSYKDKEMLTQYPIRDVDKKGNATLRRRMLQNAAQNKGWQAEGKFQRTETKPDYTQWAQRTVIVATNAAETGVTFQNCILVVDTCLVNVIYHDPSTNVKVQATMPCSKAASEQRAGRTGRDKDGRCIRLVTQDQWNRMPLRDPIQPRLIDHTQLYLRLSHPDVTDLREILLQKMSMTKPVRHRAMQKLTLLGMFNNDGTITSLGKFAADLGSEPENAVLLWYANEFQAMEDALTIFAILEGGPSFTTREQRIKVPHPDGDMHSLVNVWHYFQWLDQRTNALSKEEKEKTWSKEHVSFRNYQTVSDFRKEVADRCKLQFGNWSTDRDETYSTRLALALFKAYKLTLMIRGAVGGYTSVTDNDEWRFGSLESRSSLIKFSPQFLIAPGRMVRMMSMGTKPADMRIDLAMGVPLEFLASEMWFCTNCCRNTLFTRVLEEVRNLPILSNMTIMERLCPAIGVCVCPVPFTRNAGVVDPDNAREYMQPMKWMYDRPAKVLRDYAMKYRVDIPIRTTELKVSAELIVPALKVDLYTTNLVMQQTGLDGKTHLCEQMDGQLAIICG